MTEHNCKVIPYIAWMLMAFGAFSAISIFISNRNDLSSRKYQLIYYTGIFAFSTISFLLNLIGKNHKDWKLIYLNMPVYIQFLSSIGLEIYIFFHINQPFDTFAIFACLITISQLLVNIEPILYCPIILTATIILTPRFYSLLGMTSVANLYLYTFIVAILYFNRWKTLKLNYEADKTLKEHAETIDRELLLASNVQQSFYTHTKHNLTDWEIEFYNKPMAGVTGDLYDFYDENNQLKGVCLFDVSGHGLAAGLVTMLVRNIIHKHFHNSNDKYLEETVYKINSEYEKKRGHIKNYMSGLLFRFDGSNVEFVNAAHPYPYIYRKATDKVELFEDVNSTRGSAIGLSPLEPQFFSDFMEVSSGDEIILYTDGVTEAKNAAREEYGYERFKFTLQNNMGKSLKEQIDAVINDISSFTAGSVPEDDITILILRKK